MPESASQGGVLGPGGMYLVPGGVPTPGGCLALGVCVWPGGCLPMGGACLPGGVSARGACLPRRGRGRVSAPEGVCSRGVWYSIMHCGQNDTHV